jgi:hypothetical protein
MTKPLTHDPMQGIQQELDAMLRRAFQTPPGCSEGDSAINDVAPDQSIEGTRAVAEETGCSAWTGDHCEAPLRSRSDALKPRPCFCRAAAERVLKNR